MKRRRAHADRAPGSPATNLEAPPAPPGDDDERALAALLDHALEARARRHDDDDDLPLELAAADLLRTCLSAAALVEGATREALVQTARREFDRAVKPSAARARSRAA